MESLTVDWDRGPTSGAIGRDWLFQNNNETSRQNAVQAHVTFEIEMGRREWLAFHFLVHYLLFDWVFPVRLNCLIWKVGTKKSQSSELLPGLNEIPCLKNLAQCFGTKGMLGKWYRLLSWNGDCIWRCVCVRRKERNVTCSLFCIFMNVWLSSNWGIHHRADLELLLEKWEENWDEIQLSMSLLGIFNGRLDSRNESWTISRGELY